MVVENGDTAFVPTKFLVGYLSDNDQYKKKSKDFVVPRGLDVGYGRLNNGNAAVFIFTFKNGILLFMLTK